MASFNLWEDPWIEVESRTGLKHLSIEKTLIHAHECRAIHDTSPLVMVGIHRLLTAILQDIHTLTLERPSQLRELWESGAFDEERISRFGEEYGHRFDLYSEEYPFYQSVEAPLYPKGKDRKSVANLSERLPTGTGKAWFVRGNESQHIFCSACVAKEMLTLPAFATSGGRGYYPNPNGSKVYYVLPGGRTLFERLARSLLLVANHPPTATKEDLAWWKREDNVIKEGVIIHSMGYLHSLTFQNRTIRFYPEEVEGGFCCSRCGKEHTLGVRDIYYKPGEHYDKEAPTWIDPFVAYYPYKDRLLPVKMREGRSVWREYGSLFIPSPTEDKGLPPAILHQIYEEDEDVSYYPFQVVGTFNDKKKFIEWVIEGFEVPLEVMDDFEGAESLHKAIKFAEECEYRLKKVFDCHIPTKSDIRDTCIEEYWVRLQPEFETFVRSLTEGDFKGSLSEWLDTVEAIAVRSFDGAVESIRGASGKWIRAKVGAQGHLRNLLGKVKREFLGDTYE